MRTMYIDCGKKGGYCIAEGTTIVETGELAFSVDNFSLSLKPMYPSKYNITTADKVVVEALRPFHRDTATTAFTMGTCYSTLINNITRNISSNILFIEPKEWKALMRCIVGGRASTDQKEEALLFVKSQLNSDLLDRVAKKKTKHHDGIIDAVAMMLAMEESK